MITLTRWEIFKRLMVQVSTFNASYITAHDILVQGKDLKMMINQEYFLPFLKPCN